MFPLMYHFSSLLFLPLSHSPSSLSPLPSPLYLVPLPLPPPSLIPLSRWRFLIESLHDLDNQLKCFNSRLYVARGQPVAVLEKLCGQWNVTSLVFQTIGEPHSQMMETALERLAKGKGLEVRGSCGGLCGATSPDPCSPLSLQVHKFPPHMLYGVDRVLEMNQNQPVTTFNKFKELLPFLGTPEAPLHQPRLPVTKLITCEDELLDSNYR